MAAQNEGGRERHANERRLSQEKVPIRPAHIRLRISRGFTRCKVGRKSSRNGRCEEPGGSQPENRCQSPPARDLSSQKHARNEGGGTRASHPSIFERARFVSQPISRPGKRECIGQRRQRCQHSGL